MRRWLQAMPVSEPGMEPDPEAESLARAVADLDVLGFAIGYSGPEAGNNSPAA
jgi:hypothetical protein